MKRLYLLFIIVGLLLVGCEKQNSIVSPTENAPTTHVNPVTPTYKAGAFGLTYASGLAKVSSANTDSASFDLGDLKGSKSYYFILENIGDSSITSINLTSSDSSVIVTPNTIGVLRPRSQSGILQTIKVTILDGTLIENGVGSVALQPMGNLLKTLQITGTTNDSVINMQVNMSMTSYRMDVDLFAQSTSVKENYLAYAPATYQVSDTSLYLENTGNTKVNVEFYKTCNGNFKVTDTSFVLSPGDKYNFNLSYLNNDIHSVVNYFLITNTDNAIYDVNKFTTNPNYPFKITITSK